MEQELHGSITKLQLNNILKELHCLSVQKKQFQRAREITGQVSQTTAMPTSQRNAITTPVSDSETQCLKLQEMVNQQTRGGEKEFLVALMRTLLPELDRVGAMHLHTLYAKMQRCEITHEVFVRHTRDIVRNEMLRFVQLQKESPYFPANSSHASSSLVSVLTDSSYPSIENYTVNSQDMDFQSDSRIVVLGRKISSSSSRAVNQERDFPSIPVQGLGKQQQQQHVASYCASDFNTSGFSLKSKSLELKTWQLTHHQSMGSTPVGESTQATNMTSGTKFERQNSIDDPSRLQGGALNHISTNPVHRQVPTSKMLYSSPLSPVTYIEKKSVDHGAQLRYKSHLSAPQNPSITSPAGVNARKPRRKPSVGWKKQLEARGSSRPLPSKKQKVSESEQSIEQINDVTAFVNLQEEVEQLLSGRNVSQVSEAARKVVQEEEEERGILLKTPLWKKLAEITAKCGLKNISNDVERCLSMSVEERMHGLICNLIRISKQRADTEKPMHLKLITSDVRQQIIELNRKAKEEREEKKGEMEKLQKLDETKKQDAAAANVVARVAAGVDDMLSKWQHMAELAHQKHERGVDAASGSQAISGTIRKIDGNQELQTRVARTISVEDMIAVLETEPRVHRSRPIHPLYERMSPMTAQCLRARYCYGISCFCQRSD